MGRFDLAKRAEVETSGDNLGGVPFPSTGFSPEVVLIDSRSLAVAGMPAAVRHENQQSQPLLLQGADVSYDRLDIVSRKALDARGMLCGLGDLLF